jgi:hypothetical protein
LPFFIVFVPPTVTLPVVMASLPPPVLTVRSSPIVDVPKSTRPRGGARKAGSGA